MREIKMVIIHCSDSDHPAHDNIETIKDWHLERKFKDVGYHFFIRKSGVIELGRPLDEPGAHCVGYNKYSVGVCLSGKKSFSSEQFAACRKLNHMLLTLFSCTFHPHSEFSLEGKTCPNFPIEHVLPFL